MAGIFISCNLFNYCA